MSILYISETQITFDPHQSIKIIQLTNESNNQRNGRPVMYKIKTNKIQHVDAKPSCGYISGKPDQNQIQISIRALKSKQFTAKLQVFYIYNNLITEQIIQRNKKHFDINEYNTLYNEIKEKSQQDAKCVYLPVTRRGQGSLEHSITSNSIQDSDKFHRIANESPRKFQVKQQSSVGSKSQSKSQVTSSNNSQTNTKINKDQFVVGKNKLVNILLVVFIIGLLIGFSVSSYGSGKEIEATIQNQLVQEKATLKDLFLQKAAPQDQRDNFQTHELNPDPTYIIDSNGVHDSTKDEETKESVEYQMDDDELL